MNTNHDHFPEFSHKQEHSEKATSQEPLSPKPKKLQTHQPASPSFNKDLKNFFNFLCKINPFYLISACLILYSQKVLFNINVQNIWINTSIPLGVIAFYTFLMAATAIFIVRAGKVWDDARSIILICMILFLAVSVGLDGLLMEDQYSGRLYITAAFILCIVLSESIIRYMPIKLPLLFKGIFYLIMGYFYFYPFLMVHIIYLKNEPLNIMAIFLFPAIAGILFMLLLPIVKKGYAFFSENSTPWSYPFFPWIIFFIMGIGICIRTYFLSISFYAGKGVGSFGNLESGFGAYMLIPFLLPCLILILEHFIATKQVKKQIITLSGPIIFILLALPSVAVKSRLYHKFSQTIMEGNGTPIYIAFAACAVFYLYAWLRRVKYADIAIFSTLVITCFTDLKAAKLEQVNIPSIAPWLILSGIMFWMSFRKKLSFWAFAAWGCLMLALAVQFQDNAYTSNYGVLPLHLTFGGTLVISLFFKDKLCRIVQDLCGYCLPFMAFIALFITRVPSPAIPFYLRIFYTFFIIATASSMYILTRNKTFMWSGLSSIFFVFIVFIKYLYVQISAIDIKGLKVVILAFFSFIAALVISLHKGNILAKLCKRVKNVIPH